MTKLLLHCCCAPCAGAIIESLVREGMRPLIFFSNSNIVPFEEYELRKAEITRYAAKFGLEVVDDEYDHGKWLSGDVELQGGVPSGESSSFVGCGMLPDAPERGARCLQCFKFRLLRAARYAAAHGYDTLATTLASSRWKDLNQVDEAGQWACSMVADVQWWPRNWRKGGLQERRSQIIREQNFYNQTFCGCEFSHR